MKQIKVHYEKDFEVLTGNQSSQSAVMVLSRGKKEGGKDNKHENSDQWLYVVSGTGIANVDGKEIKLEPGSLVLIEKGEVHEIRNTGEVSLLTLNFYVPPEY